MYQNYAVQVILHLILVQCLSTYFLLSKGKSIGKDMEEMTGGDYGNLTDRFVELTTNADGLLGVLENSIGQIHAKVMLCCLFKVSL